MNPDVRPRKTFVLPVGAQEELGEANIGEIPGPCRDAWSEMALVANQIDEHIEWLFGPGGRTDYVG